MRYIDQAQAILICFDSATIMGIITAFRVRVAAIHHKLSIQYLSVAIDTVERFQSPERAVFICLPFAVKDPMQLRAIQSVNAGEVWWEMNWRGQGSRNIWGDRRWECNTCILEN